MNDFTTAISVTAALLLALVTHEAAAQTKATPNKGPASFSTFDRNGDGAITEDELEAVRAERRKQRAAAGKPMRGKSNAPTFAELDADGDGKVTADELAAGQAKARQKRAGKAMGPGKGMPTGKRAGLNQPRFESLDLDGDGSVTKEELLESRSKRINKRTQEGRPAKRLGEAPTFEELDANGDGTLSREEIEAHQAKRRQTKQP